jgi:hypothetical protein
MKGVKNNILEYDSGLDWLTASSISSDKRARKFNAFARYILNRERDEKTEAKKFGFGQYQGIAVPGIQYAKRPSDGHEMLRFMGESTAFYAAELIANDVPFNTTRVDAAITARFIHPSAVYGRLIRDRVEENDARQQKKRHTPLDCYKRMKGDSGVTIGSRTSDVYSRIYDWELKHKTETTQSLWRYEVELKGVAAIEFWHRYQQSLERPKLCAEMVTTRLKKYGVSETGLDNLAPCPISGTKPATDDEKKLEHFRKSLIPFISKLAERGNRAAMCKLAYEAGLVDENGVFLGCKPQKPTLSKELDDSWKRR